MNTIFFVVTRGLIMRNIVQTGVLDALKLKGDVKLVLFVPKDTVSFLKDEINDPDITFEVYEPDPPKPGKKYFLFFLRFSLITRTGMNLAWHGSGKAKQYKWVYGLAFPLLLILSVIPGIRQFFQSLERVIYPDTQNDHFFDTYKPDLVVVTSIIGQADIAFIKSARRKKVKSVALTKGWDNLDKYHLQEQADKLVVQAKPLVGYAKRYQGYRKGDVFVGGFPSFDIYRKPQDLMSREEVCKRFGLDPSRKVLFYGSEGVWSRNDTEIVERLSGWVRDDAYEVPCSLIVRPHFSDIELHHFAEQAGKEHVFLYDDMRIVEGFADGWYPSQEEIHLFASAIMHHDVMMCVRSTLTLDAITVGKPVINITTRAFIEPSGKDSTGNLYEHIFYDDLLSHDAVILSKGDDELLAAVNRCLKNPEEKAIEREVVQDVYCGVNDAPSHERIASYIHSSL